MLVYTTLKLLWQKDKHPYKYMFTVKFKII